MTTVQWSSMYLDKIDAGPLKTKYSVNGYKVLRYYINFRHKELLIHKELSAPDIQTLQSKVDTLIEVWDRQYAAALFKSTLAAGKEAADQATIEASERLTRLSHILRQTLSHDDKVDWEALKDREKFKAEAFREPAPTRIVEPKVDYAPPKITLIDILLGRKRRKLRASTESYRRYEQRHSEAQARRDAEYAQALTLWNNRKKQHDRGVEALRLEFYGRQKARNDQIDLLRTAVAAGEPEAVVEQATMVLESSDYGDLFQKDFNVEFSAADSLLLIDYELPKPTDMPILKAVKFNKSTGEMIDSFISEREQRVNYDSVCYQICIRSLHEIFESDVDNNIQSVLFNGYSSYVDKATGRDARSCIMSVLVKRDQFEALDLARVEPKACFKSLKGVSASSLAALAPIPPVMEMNREDKRFVEPRDAVGELDDATNLAAMPWEDFEHLVRQVFEQEFATRGGEVRITQASRDGGVDAIAFDPDPISGGKIVIQAKRYTRAVSVSAVRDLFGTIMNEGASKGILVTTADYGPDAYAFANGKPITLISGSNLLHLMEKHGHRAKIDIAAARRAFGQLPSETY